MKNKIKLIIAILISLISIVGVGFVFTSNIIVPNFPYKFSLIDTKIKNANVNNQSIKNYLAINKEDTLRDIKEKAEKAQQVALDMEKQFKSFSEPTGVDYGSALIFIEEQTIKNKLQVLDIKFENKDTQQEQQQQQQQVPQVEEPKKDEEKETGESQENKPVEEKEPVKEETPQTQTDTSISQIGKYTPSIIKVKVLGPYANIQEYLETLPKELGDFNCISNFKMWKTTESIAREGANKDNYYLLEDEKNMIAEFEIVLYNKN